MINYLDLGIRKGILQELNSEENKKRKERSLMNLEIMKSNQAPFVYEKIKREMGVSAAKGRTVTSINLTEKIINEQSKIYLREPDRAPTELNEKQKLHIEKIYKLAKANVKLKKLNRIYKLNRQGALQIIPKNGKIEFRPLYPHHYDVVPKQDDPEIADAYIISSYDKSLLLSAMTNGNSGKDGVLGSNYSDGTNQNIADTNDYLGVKLFYWWTDKYNFVTNDKGEFVDKEGKVLSKVEEKDILNPIQEIPFVDAAIDKDFEFYVRGGSSVTDLSLDLATLLSDTAEISRLQGFAFGVMASKEEPKDLKVGPRNYLWLKLDPNDSESARPSFSFTSPNPDLGSSLQLISNYLSMYLTSIGQSASLVSSGIYLTRLLLTVNVLEIL